MKNNKSLPTRPTSRLAKPASEIAINGLGAVVLSSDEARRLKKLSAGLHTSPSKTVLAILRNALGFSFYVGNASQSRVIDLSAAMRWA